jgi:GABA(A) receptor-associated protein
MNSLPFDVRREESRKMKDKYPDRIPCVVTCARDININKHKYLVPNDLQMGQFNMVLRKRTSLLPAEAMFVFTEKNTLVPTTAMLSNLYHEHANPDGFLYLTISKENTFGFCE